jgi:type VI secretion system protein ImpJ
MYLGPHHFQAQSRYFENAIHFSTDSLWFSPFGFLDYQLDAGALSNGSLKLTHARGVFEDGLPFDMPACDPLPEPRAVETLFPPTSNSLLVYLAVPEHKERGGNCTLAQDKGPNGTRFMAEERQVADEVTGGDEKPIRFGRKNICFMVEGERKEGWHTLPIARVLRDGANHFSFDTRQIPPVLKFSASPALMSMTDRLIDILSQKNANFTGATRGFDKQASGLSAQQIATFWFLHAVNGGLTALRHLYLAKRSHPEELYGEMLKLGGALCTFGLESSAANLPAYDHLDLQICFESLDRHIRDHLELVVPTNCISIKLEQREKYFWDGEISDTRLLGNARWYLSIAADMGEAELINGAPALIKICSSKFVRELVKRALPGMKLSHLPGPPSSLAPRISNQYFTVNRAGPCWDHILETRRVGIYVPGDMPGTQIDLLVLLDS